MQEPLSCFLGLSPEALSHYCHSLGIEPNAGLPALARAIAVSPGWPSTGATLVIRQHPSPKLAAFGRFDPIGQAWLKAQQRELEPSCSRLRYVGYTQVQKDCEALGAELTRRFGIALNTARFIAVPRGGLIVLGLLATVLGLTREQLTSANGDEILVVVDDCAVTGARFAEFLQTLQSRRIVFAPLYCHPELRRSIEDQEPTVLACLSARNIEGISFDELDPDADRHWRQHETLKCYWTGRPETLCFPWNEPARSVWNAANNRYEPAWKVVPPELCIKNHPSAGAPLPTIQIQPEGPGPLRPAPPVLFAEVDEELLVYHCDERRGFRLKGSGADLWHAIISSGSLEGSMGIMLGEYAVEQDLLRADAQLFVQKLLAEGFLELEKL